jgi:Na+/H+ antiporter NhaD/arsenite permease-like protein
MAISHYLQKLGLFDRLIRALLAAADGAAPTASPSGSATPLLVRIGLVAGVCSALVTNDTTCILLTPVVLRVCARRRLHPGPFLVCLATCSNVGSALSPIGNPQNMIIALLSGLSFLQFLAYIAAAAAVGMGVTLCLTVQRYRLELSQPYAPPGRSGDEQAAATERAGTAAAAAAAAAEGASLASTPVSGAQASACGYDMRPLSDADAPAALLPSPPAHVQGGAACAAAAAMAAGGDVPSCAPTSDASEGGASLCPRRRRVLLALLALVPPLLLLADRWIGLAWTTVLCAAALMVAEGAPADDLFRAVDGSLLLFFSGLFIVVEGFDATGIPAVVWGGVQHAVDVTTFGGLFLFCVVVLIGSNVVSNVPLVLLLGKFLAGLESPVAQRMAWAQLAFVSTVAGNLTLLGSVANLIVAERAKDAYPLRFGEYLRVGFPSTLITVLVGAPIVYACTMAFS